MNSLKKDKWMGVMVEEMKSLEKLDMGASWAFYVQKSRRMQMGLQEETSSIIKKEGKSSRLA